MSGRAVAIAALLASACWGHRSTVEAPRFIDGPVVGTRWITPERPWRTNWYAAAVLPLGQRVLLGGTAGWLTELDLGTGRVVRELDLGELSISGLTRLPDGRVLVTGFADSIATGVVVDPRLWVATPIELGGTKVELTYPGVRAVLVADGVVVAGGGLPLAIWDPSTWTKKRVISEELGWDDPQLTKTSLHVNHRYKNVRFDLATFAREESPTVIAAAHDTIVRRIYADRGFVGEAVIAGGTPVRFGEVAFNLAIDPAGRRVAQQLESAITVVSLVDGRTIARFDLGVRVGAGSKLAFQGDRLLVASGTSVTVIDLATGYVPPPGTAPLGHIRQLLVDDEGTVLTLGAEAVWLRAGAVVESEVLVGNALTNPPGATAFHGVRAPYKYGDDKPSTVTFEARGKRARKLELPNGADDGWVAPDGSVVLTLVGKGDGPRTIAMSRGSQLADPIPIHADAALDDVDMVSRTGALSRNGTIHVVDLATGSIRQSLRAPRCAEYASGWVAPGGERIVTHDDGDMIVWSARGERIASLAYGEPLSAPAFVPNSDELLAAFADGFVLWSPATQELRVAKVPHLSDAQLSPSGTHLVLGFTNGRIALVDFSTLRASLPVTRAKTTVALPEACGGEDPFDTSSNEGEDHEDIDEDEGSDEHDGIGPEADP